MKTGRIIRSIFSLSLTFFLLAPALKVNAAYNALSYASRYSNDFQTLRPVGYDEDVTIHTVTVEGETSTTYDTEYINRTNQESYQDYLQYSIAQYAIPEKLRIPVGEYTDLSLTFINGIAEVSSPESGSSAILKVRNLHTKSVCDENNKTMFSGYDLEKDGTYNYYYFNDECKKIYVGYYANLPSASVTSVKFRLFAKKEGNTTIKFSTYNDDGETVKTYKINVTATDTTPFKTITFGGKNLWYNGEPGADNKNYIYQGKKRFCEKSSGKLVIKMNSGFKLKKIEYGTLYNEETGAPWGYDEADYNMSSTDEDGTTTTVSYSGISQRHKVDLNNDGDTLDIVDGVSESNVLFRMKRIRNNKKLTLSKISPLTNYENGIKVTTTTYKNGAQSQSIETSASGKENLAPTLLKITFYDATEKQNYEYETVLNRRIKK
ncbi:hypothetical protein [Butyrivibrio sp. WCD3002]|uniref:hypothetical protein n=1 Tax=Butyrivibrio sp. WCD3002 TaxID=1280676 RepID=UPI00042823B2|nr:hypothetical protein [Butyrivibrio sp. WCD3002]